MMVGIATATLVRTVVLEMMSIQAVLKLLIVSAQLTVATMLTLDKVVPIGGSPLGQTVSTQR